ncbi:hypothetical protein GMC02_11500 [Turicibacter sanguinis]|nr:hypothetical protein [Turicibacter sanguinis]MTO04657.1 hypothetical protein [Turicibacter sanguinis]MTO13182.1 hypothetical protein [Turicibacter sanguinis]MTO38976.1 hypothetical protein [Turicibacter sanguinis]MTO41934.1 hypothetical protein [Turicibacter sanguinis]
MMNFKNKTKITLDELNEIQRDNYQLGFKCGYKKGADDLKNEVLYAQSLLEQNNELMKEVEELQDSCNELLDELDRYREILKVIAPEMIEE